MSTNTCSYGGWVRFPPNVGSVFPQMYFVVLGGILMYPSRVRYRCVSKRPSKYTQNTRKIPITKKTKYRPGIGLAIAQVARLSVLKPLPQTQPGERAARKARAKRGNDDDFAGGA